MSKAAKPPSTSPDPKRDTHKAFASAVEHAGGPKVAAVQLNISEAMVSYIISGDREPGLDVAYRIERLYGIPMKDWVDVTEPTTLQRFA